MGFECLIVHSVQYGLQEAASIKILEIVMLVKTGQYLMNLRPTGNSHSVCSETFKATYEMVQNYSQLSNKV